MKETVNTDRPDDISRETAAKLMDEGDSDKAEKYLNALLEKSPDDPELLNALGSIFAGKGNYFEAEKTFNRVTSIDPGYGDAYYNLGLVHSKQSRITEAIEDYLKAVEINPGDAAAHNDLGVLYHSQGKNHLAKGHFMKALEADQLHKRALVNLFEIHWEEDSYSQALNWIEKFLNAASKDGDRTATDTLRAGSRFGLRSEYEDRNVKTLSPVKKPAAGALIMRKRSSSKSDDLFLKHVPSELHEKKTGMNIAVVADFNIAGQLSLLFRMLNRYTIHKARMIILQGDYLSYDNDLVLSGGGKEDYQEALEVIENADFYHIGRFPKDFENVKWENFLKPDNCLVQYYGSELRAYADQVYRWHSENKITGLSAWDYTMLERSPFFYHINIMCDLSRIKPCSAPGDIVRICHPSTNREIKKTDLFLRAFDRLKDKYPVELELIEGVSNDECLDIKSRCHITYDQISVGIYGLSAIESMAAGHSVLCSISNFAASYHPDNPIVYVDESNLYAKLEYLLKNRDELMRIGNAGKIWAKTHHDPMKIIKQYLWLYDLVKNGHRLVEDKDTFMLK